MKFTIVSFLVCFAVLLHQARAYFPYDWRFEFNGGYWDPWATDAIYNSYFIPALDTYLYNQGIKAAAVDATINGVSAASDPFFNEISAIATELANPLTFIELGSAGAGGFLGGWGGWDAFGGPWGGWRVGGLGYGGIGYLGYNGLAAAGLAYGGAGFPAFGGYGGIGGGLAPKY